MDYLWSPWRYQYVNQGVGAERCMLCAKAQADPALDREELILRRAEHNFILLNLYPYTTGHCMIAPFAHVPDLARADPGTVSEMMLLARDLQRVLESIYHPEGYNLGINLGRSAGAGVASHLHFHILPRWNGDTNFMTVIGETRVLPEDLGKTYKKLVAFLRG